MPTQKSYKISVLAQNCFLQKQISLESGVTIEPLPPLGMKCHKIYIDQFLQNRFGIKLNEEGFQRRERETESLEPVVFIKNIPSKGMDVMDAEKNAQKKLNGVYSALSFLTSNPVKPFFLVVQKEGEEHPTTRVLPLTNETRIWHSTNIPGFFDDFSKITEKSMGNPLFSLALDTFRVAQNADRIEFRIFHYVQVFEILTRNYTERHLSDKIKTLLAKNEIKNSLESAVKSIVPNIIYPDRFNKKGELIYTENACHFIVHIRNAIAHNGELSEKSLSTEKVDCSYIFPILERNRLEDLTRELREILKVVFSTEAGGGLREAKKITLKEGGSFEIKFD